MAIKKMTHSEPYKRLIIFLSITIPLVVAGLFGVKVEGYDLSFLPPTYAFINGLTCVLLLVALWAIKNKKIKFHEYTIKTCMGLSVSFLLMYVLYHITSDSTSFGGEGLIRYIYFFVLITHIFLSIGTIPLILFTFSRAISGNFEKHKYLARWAFPIWLYVSFSGVVVYFMIKPYY